MTSADAARPGRDDQLPAIEERDLQAWVQAMVSVASHYRLEFSEENVRLTGAWSQGAPIEKTLRSVARQLGLSLRLIPGDVKQLTPWRLPVIVQFQDGQVAVVHSISASGEVGLSYCGDGGLNSVITRQQLAEHVVLMGVLRPVRSAPDSRVDAYIKPYERHWFTRIILRDLKPYGHVMLAALMANVLALAGILFSRQVYDRVIPAESFPTLYVLFSGVLVAMLFDFAMRVNRVRITDLLGKRADIQASDRVFGHALRVKGAERPQSTGTYIAQVRELEHVRELLTSTTVAALSDLPFFALFCLLLWYIAGPLVLFPVSALVLMILPRLLVQKRLAALANEAMRESSLRNALLVESIQGLEDIKSLQAEQRFQGQWNHYNAVTAESNLKLRAIANNLGAWSHCMQNGVFAGVVFFGAPMVMDANLSIGSLVAASILASRMMAPMAQVTQVMSKWQQAKIAMKSLDSIMQLPVDDPEAAKKVHRPHIHGRYELKNAVFNYGHNGTPALTVTHLKIEPGERIALLGRNGAGKSTLLQTLAGFMEPVQGEILLDGINLHHLDPADVRRDVGLLSQNSRLFHGTIRDNLMLGAPAATEDELLDALAISGAGGFIRKAPNGLDYEIQEGGVGLSGGQRQSILLARYLVRDPHVLLLDEPTAFLDEATEKRFIHRLHAWIDGKTLVVATHRLSILSMVERIVVVDAGQVLLDGPKNQVLARLAQMPSAAAIKKPSIVGGA